MILIKSIEVFKCDQPVQIVIDVIDASINYDFGVGNPPAQNDLKLREEIVRGRRFVNRHGVEVCLGLTKQVEETIGLEFECFDKLQNENYNLSSNIKSLQKFNNRLTYEKDQYLFMLDKYTSLNFFGRLKFLFTGRV